MPEMHECVWSAFNSDGLLCCPVCSTVAENQPFKKPETCGTCGDSGVHSVRESVPPSPCPDCTEPETCPKCGGSQWEEGINPSRLCECARQERWNALARRPCRTCFGNGYSLFQYDRPGGIPGNRKQDCPDCQGTGLAMPELTRECYCLAYHRQGFQEEHKETSTWCHGTGRILLSGDLLLAAGERALGRYESWQYAYYRSTGSEPHQYILIRSGKVIDGADRLTALICALEALHE